MLTNFKNWYRGINKSKAMDYYAPHKPLTILYALSKSLNSSRWISYSNDRKDLESLIANFTKYSTKPNCLQPLWRLTNDSKVSNLWITIPNHPILNKSGDVSPSTAKSTQFKAGFSDKLYSWLTEDKSRPIQLIKDILEDNFPENLHKMILDLLSVDRELYNSGIDQIKTSLVTKVKRDPLFPKRILSLYDNQCAFCGLKLNFINSNSLNMEAAHIKWKARGGECNEENGISLCPTHHYTFDRGIWTLTDKYEIILSKSIIINKKTDTFFTPYIGNSISRFIMNEERLPSIKNIQWHQNYILKR